jgi:hypothetical protein
MHFEDLSTDSYLGWCPHVRSVGWLAAGHEFPTGDPPPDLVPLLELHLKDHWAIFAAAGKHDCEFCAAEGCLHADSRNLFIPGADAVYFAPGMIVHYITQHRYLPPYEFIEALRLCPPQGSADFMTLMMDFGTWHEAKFAPPHPQPPAP